MSQKTFGLRTPRHLHDKLTYDIARLRSAQSSDDARYAAFDCAVDAWHLTDWVLQAVDEAAHMRLTGKPKGDFHAAKAFVEERDAELPALKYCRDLANGVKHFSLRATHSMQNVASGATVRFTFASGAEEGGVGVISAGPIAYVVIDDENHNVIDLFEDMRSQWRQFLIAEGLKGVKAMTISITKKPA
jgi:hypothetical protein